MHFYIKRKDRIILTAIEIIDELGFQGLSTKEISKRQQVSEATLYKYYKSKNEIILNLLESYSKFDLDIKQTIELNHLSCKESIAFLMTKYAEYYENYPAMTAILSSYEYLQHEKELAEKVIRIFESRVTFIKLLIDEALKKGEFQTQMDSEALVDVIIGACHAVVLKWRIRNYNFSLKERIKAILQIILER